MTINWKGLVSQFNKESAKKEQKGVTEEIVKYITTELQTLIPKDTNNLVLKDTFQKWAREAQSLLDEIKTQTALFTKQSSWSSLFSGKLSSPQITTANKHLANYRAGDRLKMALTKGYAFIMKVRQYLTGEQLDYLMLFEKGTQQRIRKFSLKELIPALSIAINETGKIKLQINRFEELIKIEAKQELAINSSTEKSILKRYNTLVKTRRDRNIYWGLGFSFEAATRGVAFRSKQTSFEQDQDPFYTGGDLRKGEVPLALRTNGTTNLELKRVNTSVGNSSVGAGLASSNSITLILQTIINICSNKKLTEQNMKDILNQAIFNAKTRMTEKVADQLVDATYLEIEKVLTAHNNK